MPYCKDLSLLFLHVPKTGGSSVEEYLKTKSSNVELLYPVYGNPILPEKELQKISLQHQTYSTIYKYRDVLGVDFEDPKLKIFTIVRNPYNRVLSAIMNKLITWTDPPQKVYHVLKYFFLKKDFVMPDHMTLDNHNLPAYEFLIDETGELIPDLTIFHTETLTHDMHQYGFTDYVGKEHDTKYFHYLCPESIELINDYYHMDFELFGYPRLI